MVGRRSVLVLLAAAALGGACGRLRRGSEAGTPATIDLNTASLRRIETLPGITPSMARRIVDGRPYGRLEELSERGILSEREIDRIRDRVTLDGS